MLFPDILVCRTLRHADCGMTACPRAVHTGGAPAEPASANLAFHCDRKYPMSPLLREVDSVIPRLAPRRQQHAHGGVIALALLAPIGGMLLLATKAVHGPAQRLSLDAFLAP
jgi:hypothetical protein